MLRQRKEVKGWTQKMYKNKIQRKLNYKKVNKKKWKLLEAAGKVRIGILNGSVKRDDWKEYTYIGNKRTVGDKLCDR